MKHKFINRGRDPMAVRLRRRTCIIGSLLALVLMAVGGAMAAEAAAPESFGAVGSLFSYFAKNPFAYLFLALAVGYPLGRVKVGAISLGTTAGTLVVGIAIALTSSAVFGITYSIPGLVQDIFLMMFMYALGMKVGPQFFSGLARGGLDFVVIAVITCVSLVAIGFFGAKLVGLPPGYGVGLISGSYTVTAVMGVAGSAVSSGAFKLPAGMTQDMVMANMAAGYAISYILSSLFTILFIKYLPTIFGYDPVKSAKEAEASFQSGEDGGALPRHRPAHRFWVLLVNRFARTRLSTRSWLGSRFRTFFISTHMRRF